MFQIEDDSEVDLTRFDKTIEALLTTGSISIAEYVGGYDFVYDYCHQRSTGAGANMVSKSKMRRRNLYLHIEKLLEDHVRITVLKAYQETVKVNATAVLPSYYDEWLLYNKYKPVLVGICRYLNDKWVKVQLAEGRGHIHEMDRLIRNVWKEHFFDKVNAQVTDAALNLLQANRNGDAVDTALVGNVVKSYVELDGTERMDTYRRAFEKKFIKMSLVYYEDYFARIYSTYPTLSEFIEHVQCRMAEEAIRTSFLPKTIRTSFYQELEKRCAETVIAKHFDKFPSESETLIRTIKFPHTSEQLAEQNIHLKRLYEFVANTSKNQVLCEIFKNHVQRTGEEIATQCAQQESIDAIVYINTIYKVYENYNSVVVHVLNEDSRFMGAFDEAFRALVNSNDVTKKSRTTSTAHQLNKYCDVLLRKTVKKHLNNDKFEDKDKVFEDKVHVIMNVLKYVEDKDLFQKMYLHMLARRLINRAFASKHAEEQIISSLKLSYTPVYTRNMEILYNEITSSNLNENFQKHLQANKIKSEYDVEVDVVNAFAWPIQSSIELQLPDVLQASVHRFNSFYGKQYKGRKLSWLYTAGKGKLVTHCFDKAYQLQVSTLQMAVLLQFNRKLKFTVQELVENTLIQEEYLKEILLILLRVHLLKNTGKETLSANSVVELNFNFESQKIRNDINKPLRIENDSTLKQVERDRQRRVAAAIVRIVKKHKKIQEIQLITKVLTELSSWFKPDVQQIKQSIEMMTRDEYIVRKGDAYYYQAEGLATGHRR